MFGKNMIITDNSDWTAQEIVEASLDRWHVEDRFRLSNVDDPVAARPIRHWTNSKIRCHKSLSLRAEINSDRFPGLDSVPSGLNRAGAAVHHQCLTGHKIRGFRAQEQDRPGHIRRLGDSS